MISVLKSRRRSWTVYGWLALIAAIAGLFRFWQLSVIPPGLHYDEAFNETYALRVYRGQAAPIFITENNGEEPLHVYLTAGLFHLIGPTPLGGRMVSAAAGVVAVVVAYFLGAELFRESESQSRARRIGLLASLVMATWYWPFHYSRIGMEPSLLPPVAMAAVLFIWRAVRTRRPMDAALGGAFTSLALYTYTAGRAAPLVAAAIVVHRIIFARPLDRRWWLNLGIGLAAAGIVYLPLGLFYARHPEWIFLRVHQVSSPALGGSGALPSVWSGVQATVLGLFWRGDRNWRQNLSGRPAFDILQAAFFVVGLAVCARRWRKGAYWFLPFWATVGLLPTALSEYAPQFGRAIGATPPLAIVVALGMWSVATLPGSFSRSRRLRTGEGWGVRALVIGLAFAASTGWAFRDYFFVWARSPQLFIAFDVGLRAIGEYASQLPTDEPVYLSPVPGDRYTLSFFMGDDATRLRSFNGRRCLVFPARTQAPTHMIVVVRPGEDDRSLGRLAHLFPAGQPVWRANDREAPYAVDFRIPTGETASVAPGRPFRADFGHQVELLGYDLSADSIRPGETLTVSLLLKSQSPMTTDYTGFVHLTGPYSVGTRRRLWAQRDARPCDNSYLTTRWQAGEIVWDDSSLTLPVGAPPGDYGLRIGMYNLATGARLPVTAAGNTVSDDSLTLTRVVVKE